MKSANMKVLIMQFLQPPVTSSLVGPSTVPSTVIKRHQSAFLPYVKDQVSCPYKTVSTIYIAEIEIGK
jgi:hypothetical protein